MKGKTGLPNLKQKLEHTPYYDSERKNSILPLPAGSIYSWLVQGLPTLEDTVGDLEDDHPSDQEDIAIIKKILKGIMNYLCEEEFEWEDFEDMSTDDITELIKE
jgi:hypothetical protein